MLRRLGAWLRGEEGAIAPILGLLLIPIIGMLAMGGEVSGWYMKARTLQNAADSAALAAATNGNIADVNGVPGYQREAIAAAGQYGFQSLSSGDTVVTPSLTDCPGSASGANDCYKVVLQQKVPLYLTQIVGYRGNTTTGTRMATWVSAVAVARGKGAPDQYCLVGLDSSGQSFRINGGSKVDFNGCSVMSNGSANCNGAGADNNMGYGDAVSTSDCGSPARAGRPPLADPYALLNNNGPIPAPPSPCSVTATTPVTTITSIQSTPYCGSVKLGSDITVNTADTKLTIFDGNLDLNGYTLRTGGSGSMTIILTGTKHQGGSLTIDHTITGSGTIDITAPLTGTAAVDGGLKGVAILQDGRMNGNKDTVDFTYAGNTPTLSITGLIYMPLSNFTMKGAINHRTEYLYCVSVVTKTILASGTGALYANSSQDCHVNDFLTGLDVAGTAVRQALVQ